MILSVVLPCYQEADNLDNLLPKIKSILSDMGVESEILVIDTMTEMDNTRNICDKYDVKYIPRSGGNSYGNAIRTGIEKADGKYILFMDSDGSHNPEDIQRLYSTIVNQNDDIVIGSRYIKGGSTENPFVLVFMSYLLNISYKIVFNLNIKDVSNSFRIYDFDKLKNIKLECDNFDIVEEILIKEKNKHKKLKISEIPISFNKRMYGESKRDLINFIFSYLGTMAKLKKLQLEDRK